MSFHPIVGRRRKEQRRKQAWCLREGAFIGRRDASPLLINPQVDCLHWSALVVGLFRMCVLWV